MRTVLAKDQTEIIGKTPLLRIPSLSKLSGSDIFVKCEFMNPGGSVKDRAARFMIDEAIANGSLRSGMTVIEGTAGNTGIGLTIVAKAYGLQTCVVMPKGQALEKERMVKLFGASVVLTDPVPFRDERHFYHTARRMAEEEPEKYWWANQFENLSNFRAHLTGTGPEIWEQCDGQIDGLVTAAGTGGTIAGCSAFLKSKDAGIKVYLADPDGSGLYSYLKTGAFATEGSSLTEGIGIMRLVANFAQAKIDNAYKIKDQELVSVARYVREEDGLILGSSSALNVAAALRMALELGRGKRIVTFACDLGERSYSKLYNPDYLRQQGLDPDGLPIEELVQRYRAN